MKFMKWTLTLVVCLCVFGALAAYKVNEIREGIAAGEAYPEQSETVEEAFVKLSTDYRPTITVIGEIVAPRRLDMRNEFAGEITEVNFASGATVSQGQLLVKLDTSLEEANLEAAHARANLAQLVFDRNVKLLDSGLSTQEQLDRARSDLSSANAEIAVLERTIAKKTMRAPFRGRAGLHTFEVGEYLQQNTLITSLVGDTDNLWVDFQVPQFYLALEIGSKVTLGTIGDGMGGKDVSATVIAENTVLNAGSRSRAYRASLSRDAGQFAPQGMVNLQAPIGEAEPLLSVPSIAVQNDPLGQYVFVLNEDEGGQGYRAVRQQVKVTVVNGNTALLETGTDLVEGQRIAAHGAFKLYEGILVIIGERPVSQTLTQAGEEGGY